MSGSPVLALTGERTLPGVPDEAYWFERHVVAYDLAAARVRGRVVLDAGCGEGYGAARLAGAGATRVIAVDLDAAVIDHVRATYGDRVEATVADLTDLPLDDDSCDLVVSFQVIEHLVEIPAFLAELRRVLREDGELIVATPNRLTFTPGSEQPLNPFHVREFSALELRRELEAAGFAVDAILGVHHGPALLAAEAALQRPLQEVLTAGAPASWPPAVRDLVHRVRASWFELRADDLDASLDLVARCRARL